METINDLGEQYALNGVIRQVLRDSGIDYTGDRLDPATGDIIADTPAEAAQRLAAVINPDNLKLLRSHGIEV